MKVKIILLTLVSVFLSSTMILVSSAQTRTVGVSASDWFKYDFSFSWNSTDPNAPIPPSLVGLNETEWQMISIVSVSGTNVTGQLTTHFKNGTEKTVADYVDIETGEGKNMTMLVISANLNANDTVYTSGIYSTWKINETTLRAYPDGTRETNHLNITIEIPFPIYIYLSSNYYWDKSTGIIVEMSIEGISQEGGYETSWSRSMRIIESNIWIVPEFPSFLILPLFIIATLLAVMVYKRKYTT